MGNSVQDQHAPIIEIKGLHKAYGELEVLKGIDVTAKRGDVVALIGSSGSGKSTLLRCAIFAARVLRFKCSANLATAFEF